MSNINFEADQREDLDGANDANKLSDQVVKLQELEAELLVKEQEYKEMKRKVELVSSEVIPTMMQEMNISTLKLADGTSVEVKPVYGASIPADKKEEAFTIQIAALFNQHRKSSWTPETEATGHEEVAVWFRF